MADYTDTLIDGVMGQPIIVPRCTDCGALVGGLDGVPEHNRFHDILNDHARAIAVLVNSHLTERIHDRYDVRDRIGSPVRTGGKSG